MVTNIDAAIIARHLENWSDYEKLQTKTDFITYVNQVGLDNSSERIEIYFRRAGVYLKYTFIHVVHTTSNANNRRIAYAEFTSESLQTVVQLTTRGEWKAAIKLTDRPDFSGGIIHGDELYEKILFIFDGIKTDISDIKDKLFFDELKITQNSQLYDPQDNTTHIADHFKEYIFTNEKLLLNQTVERKVAGTIKNAYLAMFPVSKAVSNKISTNLDETPVDIVFGRTQSVTSVTTYNEAFNDLICNSSFSFPFLKGGVNLNTPS